MIDKIKKKLRSVFNVAEEENVSVDHYPPASVIFDADWYLQAYVDIEGLDPYKHYWEWGHKEARRPSLYFDPAWYAVHRPDVPVEMQLSHYCEYGWREGSSPSPFFDTAYYLHMNPDVAAADCEPLQHYLSLGWRERRSFHPHINVDALFAAVGNPDMEPIGQLFRTRFSPGAHPLLNWADLQEPVTVSTDVEAGAEWVSQPDVIEDAPEPDIAVEIPEPEMGEDVYQPSPAEAPVSTGEYPDGGFVTAAADPNLVGDELSRAWIAGDVAPWFDERWYMAQYPDILHAGQNAFDHYRTVGWKENRWPNALFDPGAYRIAYPDLTEEDEPLDHYVKWGRLEGRSPSSLFHAEWFIREWQNAHGEAIEEAEAFFVYLSRGQTGNVAPHPLFNPIWYRMQKGAETVERPLEDYLHNREKFISPHPLVDEKWYHDTFMPDDRRSALKQYLEYGHHWAWSPHPLFDESFYKSKSHCGIAGLMHYILYGEIQGIRPNAYFSPFYYKVIYHYLADVEPSPLTHFARTGDAQGLSPSSEFNAKLYRSRYLSFSQEWRALQHFMTKGRYEGIDIKALTHPRSIREWLAERAADQRPPSSLGESRLRVKVITTSPPGASLAMLLDGELRSANNYEVTSVIHVGKGDDLSAHVRKGHEKIDAYLLVDGDAAIAGLDLDILAAELRSGQAMSVVPMVVGMSGIVVPNNDALQDAILRPLDWYHPQANVRHKEVRATGPVMLATASGLAAANRRKPSIIALRDLIDHAGKRSRYLPRARALTLDNQYRSYDYPATQSAKRLLYIDSTVPRPDQDAGSDTAFRVLKMLKEDGWDVTFLPDADYAHDGRYTEALQDIGIRPYYLPYIRYSAEFIENSDQEFDVVFLARVYSGGQHFDAVRNRWPTARIVFNTVDLHYLREQREAVLKDDVDAFANSINLKKKELDIISNADASIVLSSKEYDILEQEGITGNIFVVPPVFSADRYIPYDPSARKDIFFLGGYAHTPNVDAVDFFVKDVWPLVLEKRKDIIFNIAGSKPPKHFEDYVSDTVNLVGYVEDLDDFLSGMRLNIAPLRYGAGVKVKVIAGLASGVPCIATSVAVEGTGIDDGNGVVIANDPKEIANAIISLYDNIDLLNDLSENGRELVEKNYSMKKIKSIYDEILAY